MVAARRWVGEGCSLQMCFQPVNRLPVREVEFTLDEAVDIAEVVSATEVIVVGSIDGEGWVTSIVAPSREILVISLLPAGGCTPKIGHNVTQINPRFEAGSTFTQVHDARLSSPREGKSGLRIIGRLLKNNLLVTLLKKMRYNPR